MHWPVPGGVAAAPTPYRAHGRRLHPYMHAWGPRVGTTADCSQEQKSAFATFLLLSADLKVLSELYDC